MALTVSGGGYERIMTEGIAREMIAACIGIHVLDHVITTIAQD